MNKKRIIFWIVIISAVIILFSIFTAYWNPKNIDIYGGMTSFSDNTLFSMDGHIYKVDSRGTSERLTNNSWGDKAPNYSPDGSKIVFTRPSLDPGAKIQIFVANPDGTDERLVYPGETGYLNSGPIISANNKKIYFSSFRRDSTRTRDSGIVEMNIDGTGFKLISGYGGVFYADSQFLYGWAKTNRIFKINLANLQLSEIGVVNNFSPISHFQLSPDGKKILFIHLPDKNKTYPGDYPYQIYTGNIDGSNIVQVTHDEGGKWEAIFSNDGSKIIFIHKIGSTRFIKSMNLDGTDIKTLFHD